MLDDRRYVGDRLTRSDSCVDLAGGVFLTTEGGQEWFEGIATEAEERATEQAR